MNFSLAELCVLLVFMLLIVYWWRSRELHSLALLSARKYCQQRGIQLLDETLVFRKFAMTRATNGRRYFTRIYCFDFSEDGPDRRKGEIILRGNYVLRVMLEAEQLEITEY